MHATPFSCSRPAGLADRRARHLSLHASGPAAAILFARLGPLLLRALQRSHMPSQSSTLPVPPSGPWPLLRGRRPPRGCRCREAEGNGSGYPKQEGGSVFKLSSRGSACSSRSVVVLFHQCALHSVPVRGCVRTHAHRAIRQYMCVCMHVYIEPL